MNETTEGTIHGPLSAACGPILEARDLYADDAPGLRTHACIRDAEGGPLATVPKTIGPAFLEALLNYGDRMYRRGLCDGENSALHRIRSALGL